MFDLLSRNESAFLARALEEGLRSDGRRTLDRRPLEVQVLHDGSALAQLGATRVLATVTAELAAPSTERQSEGLFQLNFELEPTSSSDFETGRAADVALELGRLLERGLKQSGAVDLESLVVQAGRNVWSLRVDVRVLDNGGSLATAASVAVLAALLSHRRPEASVSAETGEVVEHSPSLREPLALSLHHKPLAVAFALFQGTGCTHVVMDPSAAEEKGCRGTLVVMANSHSDLCCISQCGGVSPTRQQLLDCVSEAHREVAAMLALVNAELERHSLERIRSRVRRHAAGAPPPLLLGQPLSSAGVSLGGLPGESSGEEEEVVQADDAVPGAPFPFSGSIQPEVRSDRPPAPAEGLPERGAAALAAVAAASLPVPHLQASSLTDAVKHKRR